MPVDDLDYIYLTRKPTTLWGTKPNALNQRRMLTVGCGPIITARQINHHSKVMHERNALLPTSCHYLVDWSINTQRPKKNALRHKKGMSFKRTDVQRA